MNREIPISTHPEYRMWMANESLGKPHTFARSQSSLSCGAIRDRLFAETSQKTREDQSLKEKNRQSLAEEKTGRIKVNGSDKFSEFWKTGSPKYSGGKASDDIPSNQQISEETDERSYFFSDNPVVKDEELYEDYYTSWPSHPLSVMARDTYSADSSDEIHLIPSPNAPNYERCQPFFIIPIKVEFDEGKEERKNGGILNENTVQKEGVIHILRVHNRPQEAKENDGPNGFDEIAGRQEEKDREFCPENPEESSKDRKKHRGLFEANTEDQNEGNNTDHREPLKSSEPDESKEKLLQIQSILDKAGEIEEEVNAFDDNYKTKQYLILEEVLTCCLIDLDGIEASRNDNVRLARKKAVQTLQKILAKLERNIVLAAVDNEKQEGNN